MTAAKIWLRHGCEWKFKEATSILDVALVLPRDCTVDEAGEYVLKMTVQLELGGKVQVQGPVRLIPVVGGIGALERGHEFDCPVLKIPIRAAVGQAIRPVFSALGTLRHGAVPERLGVCLTVEAE